jgi:hypothetical protein
MLMRCPSLDKAQDLIAVLSNAEIFMLRQSDQIDLDFYFVVTGLGLVHGEQDWTTVPRDERRWDVTVNYARVDSPAGVLTPINAWTYDLLAAGYRDYLTVRGAFTSYTDLLQNTPHA